MMSKTHRAQPVEAVDPRAVDKRRRQYDRQPRGRYSATTPTGRNVGDSRRPPDHGLNAQAQVRASELGDPVTVTDQRSGKMVLTVEPDGTHIKPDGTKITPDGEVIPPQQEG